MEPIDIEALRSQYDIVAVVRRYVGKMAKSGGIYKACCPLHKEKTPSFAVFPGTQKWYCFGACGRGGDVLDFVQAVENLDNVRAAADFLTGNTPPTPRRVTPDENEDEAPPVPLHPELAVRLHQRLDAEAWAWWRLQGVSDEVVRGYLLGVCERHEYGRCYTIPVYERGVLVNVRMRLANPPAGDKDKYRPWSKNRGRHLFNGDALDAEPDTVIVTAGEKKVLVLASHGYVAVSPTGGAGNWKDDWTSRLRRARRRIFAYDPEEQKFVLGFTHKGEYRMGWAELMGEETYVAHFPDKPDDYLLAHGVQAFQRVLDEAEPVVDTEYWSRQYPGLWRNLV